MAGLHLIKLCVGCDSVEDLEEWIAERLRERGPSGEPGRHAHVTRMMPNRKDELLEGGSLYWVIKAQVQCRQRILAVDPVVGADGISRCALVLEPQVVRTQWQPRRAFQGWRYLKGADAPADLRGSRGGLMEMPPKLRHELAELGLL